LRIFGQVAQSVEQGTENPRVGGSTPSLATILALPLLVACQADPCDRLCDRLGNRLAECITDWPVDWEDFDTRSKLSFQQECREDWDVLRSSLEPRQVTDAMEQCEAGLAELVEMRQDGSVCDQLRALYVE
jgi:hypothetical protein